MLGWSPLSPICSCSDNSVPTAVSESSAAAFSSWPEFTAARRTSSSLTSPTSRRSCAILNKLSASSAVRRERRAGIAGASARGYGGWASNWIAWRARADARDRRRGGPPPPPPLGGPDARRAQPRQIEWQLAQRVIVRDVLGVAAGERRVGKRARGADRAKRRRRVGAAERHARTDRKSVV